RHARGRLHDFRRRRRRPSARPHRTGRAAAGQGLQAAQTMNDIAGNGRVELYPEIEPNRTGHLALDARHRMYWEECGNPQGVPVLFLHGGPGAGSSVGHRRYFDPAFYRIVIFDQRGAGRSTPYGELIDNTTAHLIEDIEKLRQELAIERWAVCGGSWGSTLALAYGEAHSERCLAFVLRGIFLCRDAEVQWFLYGLRNVFPEMWRRFAEAIPEAERDDLLSAYS